MTAQERLPACWTLSPPGGRTSSTHIAFLNSGCKPLQSRHAAAPVLRAPRRSWNSSNLSHSSLQLHNTESSTNARRRRCDVVTLHVCKQKLIFGRAAEFLKLRKAARTRFCSTFTYEWKRWYSQYNNLSQFLLLGLGVGGPLKKYGCQDSHFPFAGKVFN